MNAYLANDRTKFGALVAFLVLCFFFGGSSRADMVQLVVLRPLTILLAAYGLAMVRKDQLQAVRVPFAFVCVVIAVVGLQLVPLPHAIWSHLPTHELIADIDRRTGLGEVWRPISIAPAATASALFSLAVPLGALVLFAIQEGPWRRRVWTAVLWIALASSVLGLFQVLSGNGGILYFYRLANFGSPIGFFANRNHHAVFQAVMLVVACGRIASLRLRGKAPTSAYILPITVCLFAVPVVMSSQSRAGMGAFVVAILVGAYLLARSGVVPETVRLGRKARLSGNTILAGGAALAVAMFAVLLGLAGQLSVTEMFGISDGTYETRLVILPIVLDMAASGMPMGYGAGAFVKAFYIFEPAELVSPQYINHAHNDWLQPVVEAGLAGLLLVAALGYWVVARGIRLFRNRGSAAYVARLTHWSVISLLLGASIVDYPLRTPAAMAILAIAVAALCLADDRRGGRGRHVSDARGQS